MVNSSLHRSIWRFKMKKLNIIFIFITIINLHAIEIAVITNAKSLNARVSKSQLKRLFLAKSDYIDGVRLKVIELSSTEYKEAFYHHITNKNSVQLRSYWTRLIFTGKALPPKQFTSKQELFQQIEEKKDIVTYLPLKEIPADTHIIYSFSIK